MGKVATLKQAADIGGLAGGNHKSAESGANRACRGAGGCVRGSGSGYGTHDPGANQPDADPPAGGLNLR